MLNQHPTTLYKCTGSPVSSDSSTPVALVFRALPPGASTHGHDRQDAPRFATIDRNWSLSRRKRAFDFLSAWMAVVLLAPVMLLTAIAVKLSSRGPVLFRQSRMGRGGREFIIYKFRTMRVDRHVAGPTVTKAGDQRLTPVGAILRRVKLDELPQLFNVIKGDMSLVGARPKVPHHQTYILRHRPGITGASAIAFRNEEHILHQVPHDTLDAYQVHVLMPLKMELDEGYMKHATFFSDLKLLFDTVLGRGKTIDSDGLLKFQHSLVSLASAGVGFSHSTIPHPEIVNSGS